MNHNRTRRGGGGGGSASPRGLEERLPPVKWVKTPSPRAENGQAMDRWERLLHKMEFFTIDLIKEGDRSLGMVIVSGKVRNKDGSTVEGIFIQKILPGSLTDKDGRIQAGDMLVEINSVSMVGATVDVASRKLRESKDSVKLKVGRPDRGAFKVPGEDAEPIYVNSDEMEDSELQAKLEKAETKAKKMEELQEKAESDLKLIREMAEKEQKSFHKKLEESEAEKEAYKKETQSKLTDLTMTLANITVDKTKLEKEVESLRLTVSSQDSGQQDEELIRLKREVKEIEGEREMTERHLRELRQEVEGNGGLRSRLSELESDLMDAHHERDTVKTQLESTCHELTVAHATLEQMQIEKTAMKEEKESLQIDLERVRKPSTGRAGVEADLALKRKELSSTQRELQNTRDEKEKIERENQGIREELKKERERASELQTKLELQQRTEKTMVLELKNKIDSQAQEIEDLKRELSGLRTQSPNITMGLKTPAPLPVDTVTDRKKEGGGETKAKLTGTMSVGIKQRSLDIEYSPEHKKAQSPLTSPRSRASSDAKNSPGKSPVKEKTASPKSPRVQSHDDSISIEAFDAIKPLGMLDNTLAKEKTQVALRKANRARNKPSREHIRSMSADNLLSDLVLPTSGGADSSSPTEKLPIPRPRKGTLEKESPSHKPLPVPRHLRSPVPSQGDGPPPQRPPKPDNRNQNSPERKGRSGRLSPPHTRAPSPKPLLPPPSAKATGLPPKPVPRRPLKQEDNYPSGEETSTKDPSQLTVKERRELAHKAIKKPPPTVPKKPPGSRPIEGGDTGPKSLSQPEGDDIGNLPTTRLSADSANSPRPVKKLPPGAFNIGIVPMAPSPFGAPRHRSNTTAIASSSREHSLEREIDDTGRDEHTAEGKIDQTDSGSREGLDIDDVELKFPPQRPPLPMNRRTASNEVPSSSRHNEVPLESTPDQSSSNNHTEEAEANEQGSSPQSEQLDYSQVLMWTPVQVAAWLTKIGAGQYSKTFQEKGVGIQGSKPLFEVDLKAMGVSTAEDRTLIKKEIKVLRQHADRQKKILEKQRKEDKKKKKKQQYV